MKILELEIGKWYTQGGGDSYLKCIHIADNYAIFIRISEVHYYVATEFLHKEEIEDDNFYELNDGCAEYYDADVNKAVMYKLSHGAWDSTGASFRDTMVDDLSLTI